MAESEGVYPWCSKCDATIGPEHIFCPKCGNYIGVYKYPEVKIKKLTSTQIQKAKFDAVTTNLKVATYVLLFPGSIAMMVAFGGLLIGEIITFIIAGGIAAVLNPLGYAIMYYKSRYRKFSVFFFFLLSVFLLIIDWTFFGLVFLGLTVFYIYTLYIDPQSVELFDRDWQYERL